MIIEGTIEYNKNGVLTEEKVKIDTAMKASGVSRDTYDVVAFALFGKTIFDEIVRAEKGVPLAIFHITNAGKMALISRQPEYMRVTAFGTTYLAKELFSLATEKEEYRSLSTEKYFELIKDYVDLSFEEFVEYCKA